MKKSLFSRDRALHSLGVATIMYETALKLGRSEEYAREMFELGWIHDIGYQYTDSPREHTKVGGLYLRERGYKYWKEVYNHVNPNVKDRSFEQNLLDYADLQVTSKGVRVTFDERLKDLEERYARDSPEYLNPKIVSEGLKDFIKD